jgi:hypothetical protein
VRADGTRIWSLMELERQLQSEVYGRIGVATSTGGGHRPPRQSQSGASRAPLGYESFERRSSGCSPVRNQLNYRSVGYSLTCSRPALFLVVSARLVSKA